jgi:glutathione S-transferase
LVGDKVTAADISLYPTLAFLQRFGVTLKDFPKLQKFRDDFAKRESVAKTTPPHWKETPPAFQIKDRL